MKYKLIITPEAVDEIQNAIDYYNEKKKGLGKRFYVDLQKQFSQIARNPLYRSLRYDNIRFAHLDTFPYAAHYDITNDIIIIQAVLCDYQNPEEEWNIRMKIVT
ncbi:MAG: type II toxin-antitoxin system RelE/ParE family toxin [Taibaiella sp.]|jgi:hypothetical protein